MASSRGRTQVRVRPRNGALRSVGVAHGAAGRLPESARATSDAARFSPRGRSQLIRAGVPERVAMRDSSGRLCKPTASARPRPWRWSCGRRTRRPSSSRCSLAYHDPPAADVRAGGQATETDIAATDIVRMRGRINDILLLPTGQPINRILEDAERSYLMTRACGSTAREGMRRLVLARCFQRGFGRLWTVPSSAGRSSG